MFLSELTKIINALPPISEGGGNDAVYVNMKNFAHLTAIIQMGVGAEPTITVEKSATGVGAGTAITFNWRKCNTAFDASGGDLLGALAAATGGVAGEAMSATDNTFAVIELDAEELGPTYPFVRVCVGVAAGLIAIVYILSGARYKEPPTALVS